jgi:GNAT superfamily N-acetyltransferase
VGLRPLIRPYDPARDAAALRALNVAHQDFSRSLEPSWPPGEKVVDDYVAFLHREVAAHDGAIFMAEADGVMAGFVCVVAAMPPGAPDDPATHAWVHDLFVLPAYRRRGLATALLSAAETFVRSLGAREMRLGVIDRNAGARALYARAGFRDYVRVLTRPVRADGTTAPPVRDIARRPTLCGRPAAP